MKERLRELLHGTGGGPAARNLAREFLQASILAALQRAGAMVPLAFQGGTALRFLYSIRRYEEVLSVKLEVDARPPSGAGLETTVVRRHVLLRIQHHDRASLLAGKLHAILQRPYPKGRDFYDLIWYLSDRAWPPPNLALLNNALAQTGWTSAPLSETSWVSAVRARLRSVRWEVLAAEVRPLLESAEDRALLTRETITSLLDPRTRPLPKSPLRPKGRARRGRN